MNRLFFRAALCGLFLLFLSAAWARQGDDVLRFRPSGIDGAGFQNVVAVDPFHKGVVLLGADVAGFHRSEDYGDTWALANDGLSTLPQLRIASIAFSKTQPNRVYAACGSQFGGGGFLISRDGGKRWEVRSRTPQFSGGNNTRVPGLPREHPRSTGNLVALDETNGVIYAATFRNGVMRSADEGKTWTTLGLDGKFCRGLALDPEDADVLYVAVYQDRVHKITGARGGKPALAALPASPATNEELLFVGKTLYSAAGKSGVFASDDSGATWRQVGKNVLKTDGPTWYSLDGYIGANGQATLFVGANEGPRSGNGRRASVFRSADGGATWTPLTLDPARIHRTVAGPKGEPWWLLEHRAGMAMGGPAYHPAQIVIDPADRRRVFVAGRSGAWRSADGGDNWYPVVKGLGVTICRAVLADPGVPGRVFVANTDWAVIASRDHLARVRQNRPEGGGSVGFDLAIDATERPGRVYAALGTRDTNEQGEIFSNPSPETGAPWTSEKLSEAAGGKRPVGIAAGRVAAKTVLLAAVEAGGVWRKEAGGAWQPVNRRAMTAPSPSRQSFFAWPAGGSVVYHDDPASGIWRSNDAGRTWMLLWRKPSPREMTSALVVDPADASRLYVSAEDGLYRLDGADKGSVEGGAVRVTKLEAMARPGPLAMDARGTLYVAPQPAPGAPGGLFASADQGMTWRHVGHFSGFPFRLSVGPDGFAYVALNGNGVVVGAPAAARRAAVVPAVYQRPAVPHGRERRVNTGLHLPVLLAGRRHRERAHVVRPAGGLIRGRCRDEPEDAVIALRRRAAPVTIRGGKIDRAVPAFGDVPDAPVLAFEQPLLAHDAPSVEHHAHEALAAQAAEEEVAAELRESGAPVKRAARGGDRRRVNEQR